MKQYRWLLASALSILLIGVIFSACQKDISGDENIPAGQAKLSIYLTDGPYDFDKVLVDVQGILVKVDTCEKQGRHDDDDDDDDHDEYHDRREDCDIWDTLQIRPGVYDLLTLRNGNDTLLASGYIPRGEIEKIKFVLGSNNSIVVDSVTYPLRLKEDKNFIYVKIKHGDIDSIGNNNFEMFLDFDVARSIRFINAVYWLKPVLKPFCKSGSGEIEGKIRPVGSHGMIAAIIGTDTAYARPDHHEGEFKIRGLKEGTYSLFVDGINGYRDTIINNIQVRRGKETELKTITLQK